MNSYIRHVHIAGILFCAILMPQPGFTGDITGQVTIYGPVSKKVNMISPYARQRYARSPVTTTSGSNASNIVVYLENPPPGEWAAREDSVHMDQKDLTFVPHVLPVMTGTDVGFLNSDDVFHNIFSLSSPTRFNLGRYPQGEIQWVTFDTPGQVDVFCDIHSAMNAVILIYNHPFFSRVQADETFRIPRVPAGQYRIHFWHEDLEDIVRQISVPDDGEIQINVQFRK